MLSPEYLAQFPNYIVELFEQYDAFVVEDFARRVAKAGMVTDTAEWQAIRANEVGLSMDELTRQASKLLDITQEDLQSMFQEAYDTYIETDQKRFFGSGLNYSRIANNPVLRDYMTAAQAQTQRSLQNIFWHDGAIKSMTGTTAVMLKVGQNYLPISQAYTMALDLAQMQVSTGVLDYNTAIRLAVKSVAKQGVSTVIGDAVGYDSGYHLGVKAAARMCVLTGVNQMAVWMNKQVCDDLDLDLVETTAHMGARPSHQVWQGKIFSRSGDSKKYPSLAEGTGYGTVSGLMGANCRHNYYGWFEGSPRAYTDQQLYEMTDEGGPHIKYDGKEYTYYEATQIQRRMERQIITTKREMIGFDATGDTEAFQSAAIKLRGKREKYMDFSRKADLLPQTERLWQDGYSRSLSGKATLAVRKAHTQQTASAIKPSIQGAAKKADAGRVTEKRKLLSNVTDEYKQKAAPGKGAVIFSDGYKEKHHQEEIRMAYFLRDTFGGDVTLLPESKEVNVKMPDFLWREKYWELKSTTTEKAIDSALRGALKQIVEKPGGVVIDFGENEFSLENAEKFIENRLSRGTIQQVDVIVVSNGKLSAVFRHKK